MTTVYGDITPRQAQFSIAILLKRALPLLIIERFGDAYVLPTNNTQVAKWRRYFLAGGTGSYSGVAGNYSMPTSTTPLVEGVTPTGRKLDCKDYTVQLRQYGDWMGFTDVILDTHEDVPQLVREMSEALGESAATTMETLRYNVLKAGTNVYFANGTARNAVNTPLTLALQRRITRALKRQNAQPITRVIKSSPDYGTMAVEPSFIALCHPDLSNDVRGMNGYINPKNYASTQPMEGEIGAVDDVRYLVSTVFTPWADAGGAAGSTVLSTTGTAADVYPVIFIAQHAFGIVPLKGRSSITPMIVNPKPTETDPLGQRGVASWKCWNATVILQDAFLLRAEVAASV